MSAPNSPRRAETHYSGGGSATLSMADTSADRDPDAPVRRTKIAKIIDDMNNQIEKIAVEHDYNRMRLGVLRTMSGGKSDAQRRKELFMKAGRAMQLRHRRKAMNAWIDMVVAFATALKQMNAAVSGFRNRGLRAAMNTMVGQQKERQQALDKMNNAAARLKNGPLFRAFNKLKAGGALYGKLKKAGQSIKFRHRRRAINGWQAFIEEKAAAMLRLQEAGRSLLFRHRRKAINTWEKFIAEKAEAMVRLQEAGRSLLYRHRRKAMNAWLPLLEERQKLKKAVGSMMLRHRRKAINTWHAYIQEQQDLLERMHRAAAELAAGPTKAAFNKWRDDLAERAFRLLKMHGVIKTLAGGKRRAAWNSWLGRASANAEGYKNFEKAVKLFVGGAVYKGWAKWCKYVETLREFPDPKERPRPMSPNAKKRVKFAVARSVNAPTRNVSADDKYQCQKHLLAPHASLLLRQDGALLRVVGVHKFNSESLCTVDLVRGYDELIFAHAPIPTYGGTNLDDERRHQIEADLIEARILERVPAHMLAPPEMLLYVPGFFGGVLSLSNELEVRVVDAKFELTEAPPAFDAEESDPIPMTLTEVLVSLVDQRGESVGKPSWCSIMEVLELLDANMILTPNFALEEDLRRRRRMQLHRTEQRKHALHHLRLNAQKSVPTAWGEVTHGPPGGSRENSPARGEEFGPKEGVSARAMMQPEGGVKDLLKQLQQAAPSKLLVDDMVLNERIDNEMGVGGGGGQGRGRPEGRKGKLGRPSSADHVLPPGHLKPRWRAM